MNAATKILYSGLFTTSFTGVASWIKVRWWLLVLSVGITVSALSVVYVTNEVRSIYTQIQQQQQEYERLQLERGKLLLEKGAWTAGARVRTIASQYLAMQVPAVDDVVLITQ